MALVIHIDGASRGNPGPAAIGVLIEDTAGKTKKEISKYLGQTTNNVAEYYALIYALQEALMMKAKMADIYTDSELLAKQFQGQYKVKEPLLQLLFKQIQHLKGGFKQLQVHHVPREENRVADSLANRAFKELF